MPPEEWGLDPSQPAPDFMSYSLCAGMTGHPSVPGVESPGTRDLVLKPRRSLENQDKWAPW